MAVLSDFHAKSGLLWMKNEEVMNILVACFKREWGRGANTVKRVKKENRVN